jgi:hypothetical protein
MFDSTEQPLLKTSAGFSYYRRSDGIYVLRFADNRRETADAWSETLPQLEHEAAQKQEHIRCLYHFQGIWLTPYVIKTVIRTARQGSDHIKSSTAILVADRFGSGLVQTILRQLPSQALQARQVFTREVDAFQWLDERLALLENVPLP